MAIQDASLSETLRVRLLSMAQARHAPRTANAGNTLSRVIRAAFCCGHESTTLPPTMASMPSAMRRSKFSRNTNHAIKAVNTPSALSNSDAPEAGMRVRPSISSTGPSMPPATTAPISQGSSCRGNVAERAPSNRRTSHKPMPEPRYNKAASSQGLICPSNSLAKGVPAPNKTAASSVAATPVFIIPLQCIRQWQ